MALQADLLAVTLLGPQGPAVAPHSPVSGRVVAKCQPHIFPQGSPAWSLQRSSWVLPFLAWCPVSGPQFFHLWNGRGGWVGREDPEDGPRSVGAASACIPPPCSPFSRPLPGPAQCWGRAPAQQVPTGRLMLGGASEPCSACLLSLTPTLRAGSVSVPTFLMRNWGAEAEHWPGPGAHVWGTTSEPSRGPAGGWCSASLRPELPVVAQEGSKGLSSKGPGHRGAGVCGDSRAWGPGPVPMPHRGVRVLRACVSGPTPQAPS